MYYLKVKTLYIVLSLLLFNCSILGLTIDHSNHQKMDLLSSEIKRIVAYQPQSVFFAAYHLESGKFLNINGDLTFPMASLVKTFIACTYLDLVDEKKIDPDKKISIARENLRPYSIFSKLFIKPNIDISLNNLLEAMMIYSENSATDILFHEIGGIKAINRFLKKNKLKGITVSRSILELISATDGIEVTDENFISISDYYDRLSLVDKQSEEQSRKIFFSNTKDSSTALAYQKFLIEFQNGGLLSTSSTNYLKKIMKKNIYGKYRLKGFLPKNSFMHKTGSLSMLTNDAGIFELPKNKGHLILVGSVLERKPYRMPDSNEFIEKRDDLLAILAKTFYDYILFTE